MSHKITVTEIRAHPDGVTVPQEQVVFTQVIDGLDLSKIVLALNKPTRARKTKAAKA